MLEEISTEEEWSLAPYVLDLEKRCKRYFFRSCYFFSPFIYFVRSYHDTTLIFSGRCTSSRGSSKTCSSSSSGRCATHVRCCSGVPCPRMACSRRILLNDSFRLSCIHGLVCVCVCVSLKCRMLLNVYIIYS